MKKLGDAYDTSPALTNQKSALENEYHYTANATANLDGSLKSKRIKACRQNDHIIKGTNNYYSNNNSSSNLTSELTDTKNESVQENAQLLSEDEFSQIKAVWKKIFLNNTPPPIINQKNQRNALKNLGNTLPIFHRAVQNIL